MKFNPKPFRLCFRILAFITPFAFLLRLFTYWFEVESATGFFKGQGLSCTLYNVLGFIVFAVCFAFVALTKSPVPTPENKLVPEEDFPEEYAEEYKLDEVLAGTYHGSGEDMTEVAKKYAAMVLPGSEQAPELEGCVAVNAELADLLQKLMDKYTFAGVDDSFIKLCFYYQHLGA